MPADTTVKVFHSGMTGAPSLSGTAGALIAVLDALLINGFGANNLDSLAIASNVATATRAAGHPFEVGSVVEISGASVSGGTINGQHRVLSRTSTTYTFATTGLADQTATGTPAHKVAAAGWDKPFSGTNLAVYRSLDVTGTQMYLRVDDSGAQEARVVGYETMSDVNTGTKPFPTSVQMSGGLYWTKSSAASAATRSWIAVADKKTLYFMPAFNGSYPTQHIFQCMFGDIESVKSGDAFRCAINGYVTSGVSVVPAASNYDVDLAINGAPTGMFVARSFSQLGSSVALGRGYSTLVLTDWSSRRSGQSGIVGHIPYPNYADGGIYISPFTVFETDFSDTFRGRIRGLYAIPQSVGGAVFASLDRLSDVTGLTDRDVVLVNAGTTGVFAFDATGPWS